MKSFVISENDANQRLDKFLQKAVPLLPKSLMYKSLRTKRIKLNGKRAEISTRLSVGDTVSLYLNDEFFEADKQAYDFLAAPADIELVYEDENILLINKPAGLCVHEDNDNTPDTLIRRIQHYLYKKGEFLPEKENSFTPSLCNRIDRNTSGIVIAAKNAETLRILNERIKERELRKFYLCIVSGSLSPKESTLKHFLLRRPNESLVHVFDQPHPDARTILTKYTVLDKSRENSLLEVELLTGRTHQIRAHMAHIGHPLIGDGKYGSNAVNRKYGQKYQLLCSYKLTFAFSDTDHLLGYLNGRTFSVKDVWFKEKFKELF